MPQCHVIAYILDFFLSPFVLFILLSFHEFQVEFSASYSSACIRSSQQFPELSITYASSCLYFDYWRILQIKTKISTRVSVYWANPGFFTSSPDTNSFYAFNVIDIKEVVVQNPIGLSKHLCVFYFEFFKFKLENKFGYRAFY